MSAVTYWPLESGRILTSPYGPRRGGFHYGVDFGFPGGSGNRAVYAPEGGRVLFTGAARGYGGPDPAGWLVIASDHGVWELGHIISEVAVGDVVRAGQRVARINPDSATNGGTAPHLHVSYMPGEYNPAVKTDPMPLLRNAINPPMTADDRR
ncbi:peptidoglycan DD-metalloendopeptidase family protein [Mycobacterium sp.]|uniref:peptidoglycan DD-metalloendopeptidase family protein n=1 Tax=Mycobacterium sp. TaxID=1785 RepID=UPI003BACC6D3